MKPDAPPQLMFAMDKALASETRMPKDALHGVLEWLHSVLVHNVEHEVPFTQEEVVLVASALSDALAEPIHEVQRSPGPVYEEQKRYDTLHLTGKLPEQVSLKDAMNHPSIKDLTAMLRENGFLEAECCGEVVGLVNPAVEIGYALPTPCRTCGSSFYVDVVYGKKTMRRKEDA